MGEEKIASLALGKIAEYLHRAAQKWAQAQADKRTGEEGKKYIKEDTWRGGRGQMTMDLYLRLTGG
jgi:hypothetical protein